MGEEMAMGTIREAATEFHSEQRIAFTGVFQEAAGPRGQ
jgi:hypothetical protein